LSPARLPIPPRRPALVFTKSLISEFFADDLLPLIGIGWKSLAGVLEAPVSKNYYSIVRIVFQEKSVNIPEISLQWVSISSIID
jgi:hypothetical protein